MKFRSFLRARLNDVASTIALALTINQTGERRGVPIGWHRGRSDLPGRPFWVYANRVLDGTRKARPPGPLLGRLYTASISGRNRTELRPFRRRRARPHRAPGWQQTVRGSVVAQRVVSGKALRSGVVSTPISPLAAPWPANTGHTPLVSPPSKRPPNGSTALLSHPSQAKPPRGAPASWFLWPDTDRQRHVTEQRTSHPRRDRRQGG